MNFSQNPEVEMVVQTVRDYVEKTLLPQEMAVEHAAALPATLIREMGDLGFFGLPFAEDDGGIGLGFTGYTLAMEQLGRGLHHTWRTDHCDYRADLSSRRRATTRHGLVHRPTGRPHHAPARPLIRRTSFHRQGAKNAQTELTKVFLVFSPYCNCSLCLSVCPVGPKRSLVILSAAKNLSGWLCTRP